MAPGVGRNAADNVEKQVPSLFNIDWGGRAGKCYECWKLDPCCKTPKDAIKCLACWCCCGPCSYGALVRYGESRSPALVNHWILPWCFPCIYSVFVRRNVRPGSHDDKSWIGDICCAWCCGSCTFCQLLRHAGNDAWNWWQPLKNGDIKLFDNKFTPVAK